MTIYVFMGPTLSLEDGRAELDAVYLPPVSQGDVYRVALKHPWAIGILDGYFEHVPAVWHKEILWAMTQGIHVYGSSSMGALRAAELASFGMEGVGKIFEAFRDGKLEDDDEVAVIHGSAESSYRPMSEAMVNVRYTLAAAKALGVISAVTRSLLEQIAKDLHYSARSYPLVLKLAAEQDLPAAELEALRGWLPQGRIDQKREDALAMLRAMRERRVVDPQPNRVHFVLEHTVFWDRAVRSAGIIDVDSGGVEAITLNTLLEELRLDGIAYVRAHERGTLRHLALHEAQRQGYIVSAEMVRETENEFRSRHRLHTPEELNVWLEENHLTGGRFEELMREEALLDLIRAHLRVDGLRRLPDHLRITGEYSRMLARARDKQRILGAHDLQNPGLEDVKMTAEALLEWYLEYLPRPVEEVNEVYAAVVQFAHDDPDAFMRAVLREFCYLRLRERSLS